MNVEIVSIGAELTFGLTVDTNAAWLSARLAAIGLPVHRHVTVTDDVVLIRDAIARAAAEATYVLVTGGLGPTADDVTREAVAGAAEKPLVLHPPSLEQVRGYFLRLQKPMPESNERQAYLPEGASAIENTCGTAPGFSVRVGGATAFVMPGVPYEMREMFEHSIEPKLRSGPSAGAIVTRTIHCFGAGESSIGDQVADLMAAGRNPTIGITAAHGIISLRIIARGANPADASALADRDADLICGRLGKLVYGRDDVTLPQAVAKLLVACGRTVATVESCTGGLLAKMFTDVSGSSAFFLGGLVAYANRLKTDLAGVPPALIERHGAVSEEVAAALAEGGRRVTGADVALATTGVAGPAGGTAQRPVGLVYVARADGSETVVKRLNLPQYLTREAVRDRTCKVVMNGLRLHLIS